MTNFKDTSVEVQHLLRTLANMVDQYTGSGMGEKFTDQRTTLPYRALSNAVEVLADYEVVEMHSQHGRVVDFSFKPEALRWSLGLKGE